MPYARSTKVAHVVYRTRRFEKMLRWYKTVFDARIQYQNPALAFLTFDNEHHRFALANMSVFQPDGTDADRQGAIGVDHLGYTGRLSGRVRGVDYLRRWPAEIDPAVFWRIRVPRKHLTWVFWIGPESSSTLPLLLGGDSTRRNLQFEK